MARLLVGLPALQGDLRKYKNRFDMLELRPLDTSLPRLPTMRKWRTIVPPGFVFSIVLPRIVGALVPGKELDDALETSLGMANAVEARCIVLATPAEVRPTAMNRKRLAALFERLPKEGVVRCWEPSGIWEREDILDTARALQVVPVLDAASDVVGSGPVVYTRLRALGKSAALSTATIDRIAERLRGRREVFVVVEGPSAAARVKTALTEALSKKSPRRAAPMVIRPMTSSTLIAEDEEQ